MMNENDDILFSQLADGELESDMANELLLNVLDDALAREKLKGFLRLRRSTAGWRSRQPQRPVMVVAQRLGAVHRTHLAWRLSGLAVAACIGGMLVLAGVWAAGRITSSPARTDGGVQTASVTPEQMQQVAKVFALHESVAGPLAWYAADDQNVRLASAQGPQTGHAPIAVLLKLDSATSPGSAGRSVVIVCREDQPAVIELPAEAPGQTALRVYLMPRAVNGKVDVQYAIAVDGDSREPAMASLTGQRRVGLAETPLGQLALGEKLLNVEAAAWPMRQEQN